VNLTICFTSAAFRVDGIPYAQIPVFVDEGSMRIVYLPTEWIIHQAVVRGTTRSPATWRAYAYGLLDWLRFCASHAWDWSAPAEEHLAHYRNELERRSPRIARRTSPRRC